MTDEVQIKKTKSNKKRDLVLSLLFDGIGMISYLIPVIAEFTDLIWAPIAGLL